MPQTALAHLLRAHGLSPKKHLGQNFLVDETVAADIVRHAGVGTGQRVVEIGPGVGSLTRPLLAAAGAVLAIEMDASLLPLLAQRTVGLGVLEVIRADALDLDWSALAAQRGGRLKLVANLPYQITSPLLLRLLEHPGAFQDLTLMLQKEVVDRLTATPGNKDYGALTVQLRCLFDVEALFEVPPGAFFPPPRVTSAVVHLTPLPAPRVPLAAPGRFRNVVRAAFGQRRKTLFNALKSLTPDGDAALNRAGIDGRRRGETLTLEEFARLSDCLEDGPTLPP
ncbi:MAG: 16S rRNA (adenine(1518)-N(6)/adenine(1519)-N(6))-dimethyltransferase RsmA [Magnetococcus sp. WYHC-3]